MYSLSKLLGNLTSGAGKSCRNHWPTFMYTILGPGSIFVIIEKAIPVGLVHANKLYQTSFDKQKSLFLASTESA